MLPKSSLPNVGYGNTVIFGCIVGSHAYGTNIEGSDTDKKWVYVQSAENYFTHGPQPQINISKDETAYELSRFLELAEKANPTILELLFAPEDTILHKNTLFDIIIRHRKAFLTKKCKLSFGGYAISQIEKAKGLEKKMNWEKEKTERKTVLDFCYWIDNDDDFIDGVGYTGYPKYKTTPIKNKFTLTQLRLMGVAAIPHTRDCYNLFHDAKYSFRGIVDDETKSNDIRLAPIPEDAYCIGMMVFNKDAYQMHCKAYNEYEQWLKNRNTQRYIDIENHGQQIDGKNMLHCIRLIETALDIAEHGELIVRRPNANYLKDIRLGKYNLEEILKHAQSGVRALDAAFEHSKLPDDVVETNYIKFMNTQIRKILRNTHDTVQPCTSIL
jgi:uncharacterized protein